MADYQFNTNLTPAAQGTSLKDLIGTASGIQSYQQAQQLNPLALQKAQMEIEQLKQINPLAVPYPKPDPDVYFIKLLDTTEYAKYSK
jgi:hypothetical protein